MSFPGRAKAVWIRESHDCLTVPVLLVGTSRIEGREVPGPARQEDVIVKVQHPYPFLPPDPDFAAGSFGIRLDFMFVQTNIGHMQNLFIPGSNPSEASHAHVLNKRFEAIAQEIFKDGFYQLL